MRMRHFLATGAAALIGLSCLAAFTGVGDAHPVTNFVASPASTPAPSALTQVSSFGSNPGQLSMFSYLPANLPANAPLVVALHGCTQSASAYYQNSGWPQLADQWKFALVFPQQSTANNSSQCFDWYTPSDDSRGQGEALSVMQMVQYEQAHQSIDGHRIFVTGLSAGGGMTADLLADYPDVFAGGGINSGLPAQCATSQTAATNCQMNNQNLTPAQWKAKVTASDSGYTGTYPKVAIWQGTADYTVYPVNGTELRDQWTAVHGISQTPSSTQTLAGGTTLTNYNDSSGKPVVQLYSISGMGHGLAVDPGTGSTQCGSTGAFFLDYICSSYYTGVFWGLNTSGGTGPTPTPTPTPTHTPTPTPTPSPTCYTATNYAHTMAGRAYQAGGYAYALGSNQNMGLWNIYTTHTLKKTATNYYVIADGQC